MLGGNPANPVIQHIRKTSGPLDLLIDFFKSMTPPNFDPQRPAQSLGEAIAMSEAARGSMVPGVRNPFPEIDPLGYSTGTLNLLRGGSGALRQAGKFLPEKIGSERGTAFGWGAYFTDTDEIAKSYAKGAGRTPGKWQVGSATPRAYDIAEDHIIKKYNAGDTKQALELLDGQITKFDTLIDRAFKSKETTGVFPVWYQPRMLYARETARELKNAFLAGEPVKRVRDKGAVTKWKVHPGKTPDQYDYLRWDALASEDTIKKINKQFVKEGLGENFVPESIKIAGRHIYEELSRVFFNKGLGGDKAASQFLLRAGIDGIKYPAGTLAGGASKHGKGAFNYVVFDPAEAQMVVD